MDSLLWEFNSDEDPFWLARQVSTLVSQFAAGHREYEQDELSAVLKFLMHTQYMRCGCEFVHVVPESNTTS